MGNTKAVWALPLILLGACGGSGGGDAGGRGSVSTTGIEALFMLSCERARTCCAREGFDTTALDDCEARSAQSELAQAVGRGTTVLIEPAYGDCLALWRSVGSICELGDERGDGCQTFFRGTIEPGGGCEDAIDCASTGDPVVCLRADDIPDTEPGVCRTLARGRLGQPCLFDAGERTYGVTLSTAEGEAALALTFCEHADGLHCSLDHECSAFLAEGAACTERQRCGLTLYCDRGENTCKPKKNAGAACERSDECALPTHCKEGVCTEVAFADTEICEGDID